MSVRGGSAALLAVGLGLGAIGASPARAQQQIPVGSSVTGQLSASDPVLSDGSHYKLFTFVGTAGQTVQIDLMSNDFDSYLYLRGVDGTDIAHDDDSGGGLNARIVQTLPATGMYTIVADTYRSGQFGAFTLQLQQAQASAGNAFATSQQLPMGSSATGQLTSSDRVLSDGSYYKLFTFQGYAGQTVQIDMMSNAFTTYLYLRDSTGSDIGHQGATGGSNNSTLVQSLPYTGTYQIVANTLRANQFGAFTLQLQAAQAQAQPVVSTIQATPNAASLPSVGQVGLNQQVQNTLTQGGATYNGKPIHLYNFACTVGQSFRMDVISTWDNYAVILDPSGTQVAFNDDGGGGTNARIDFTCPTAGTYRLGVTTYSASTSTGPYTMQVQAMTQGQPTVTSLNQPTVTPLNQPTVTPLNQPAVAPPSQPTVTPLNQPAAPAAIQPANDIPAPGQIGQISAGQSMRGRLEPGDVLMGSDSTYADIWQLQGTAGQNVAIELSSGDFDTYLQLLDATGKVLAESAGHPNSGLAFTLPTTGTYQIVVNNNGTQRKTGSYILTVR